MRYPRFMPCSNGHGTMSVKGPVGARRDQPFLEPPVPYLIQSPTRSPSPAAFRASEMVRTGSRASSSISHSAPPSVTVVKHGAPCFISYEGDDAGSQVVGRW